MTSFAPAGPQLGLPLPLTLPDQCPACARDMAFLQAQERPDYESPSPRVRIVDAFSGAGGLSLGLAEAARRFGLGTSIRLAIDNDPDSLAVYKQNFPKSKTYECDVAEIFDGAVGDPPNELESKAAQYSGKLDLLVGGPPCQGHSDLNNRTRRHDPRNTLYVRMARAAEILRPTAVIIENVPSVIHDRDRVVKAAVEYLQDTGYQVADALLDLFHVGVPQSRRRHVLLALRRGAADPSRVLSSLRPLCPEHPQRNVQWAIGDLEDCEGVSPLDIPSKPTGINRGRIDWLFDNNSYDLPNDHRPVCHRSKHSYRAMYGRLRWDRPAQTITTGFGSMGQGRYVHPSRRRTITPHEAARLQTFPDFFTFSATESRGSWARMIGNAVPPFLGISLGQELLPIIKAKEIKKIKVATGGKGRG